MSLNCNSLSQPAGCTRPKRGPVCTFYLTTMCNLACKYCYEKSRMLVPDLSVEQISAYLDDLQSRDAPIETIVLFGGEPSLRWDLVRHVASIIGGGWPVSNKTATILFTNGLLLTQNRLMEMKSWSMQLMVSFDGFDHRSELRFGSRSDEFIRRVEYILSSAISIGIPTSVAFTVGRHNCESIGADMARLRDTHRVNSFCANVIQREDFRSLNLDIIRTRVTEWATKNGVELDWKVPGHGSRYPAYFFSSRHAKYLPPGQLGTWDKTGW